MASRSDLDNYSDCSFADMIDLILKLQDDNQTLDKNLERANSRIGELLDQVLELQDLAYP